MNFYELMKCNLTWIKNYSIVLDTRKRRHERRRDMSRCKEEGSFLIKIIEPRVYSLFHTWAVHTGLRWCRYRYMWCWYIWCWYVRYWYHLASVHSYVLVWDRTSIDRDFKPCTELFAFIYQPFYQGVYISHSPILIQ